MVSGWSNEDVNRAWREGWFIPPLCGGIQNNTLFDYEAHDFVVKKAEAGSEFHQRALTEATRRRMLK